MRLSTAVRAPSCGVATFGVATLWSYLTLRPASALETGSVVVVLSMDSFAALTTPGVLLGVFDGLVLLGLGLPLFLGRVPPNRIYGYRVRATLSDPSIWKRVNRRAGLRLMLTGGLSALTTVVVATIVGGEASLMPASAVLVLGCLWVGLAGWFEVRKYQRESTPKHEDPHRQ